MLGWLFKVETENKKLGWAMVMAVVVALASCGGGGSTGRTGSGAKKKDVPPVQRESLSLTLSSSNNPLDSDPSPTLEVGGLAVLDGTIQLFSDRPCTTAASAEVAVSSSTVSITADSLDTGEHQFYVRHTDSANNRGTCFGPVAYTMEVLSLSPPPSDSSYNTDPTPEINVDGLVVHNGKVQLFDDSACSTVASDEVTVSSGMATITANELAAGKHHFYAKHTDENGNEGECVGSVGYQYHRGVVAISMGGHHSCAILEDESLVCWGRNLYGQLGVGGTSEQEKSPTEVYLGAGRTAKAIGLGRAPTAGIKGESTNPVPTHSCAILDNGELKCWGDNRSGQSVGGTDELERHSPGEVDLPEGRTAKAVSLGYKHTCAILDDDSLVCWGVNSNGQLGNGSNTNRNAPTPVNLGDGRKAKAVSLGASHTCAILDNGELKCWGNNAELQLGDGGSSHEHHKTPTGVPLGSGRTAKAISLGYEHTCAILDDDSLKCWGNQDSGRLGTTVPNGFFYPVAVNLGTGRTAKAISLGTSHTCAILDDDSLKCWGNNISGKLGDGTITNRHSPTPVDLGTGRTAKAISLGTSHTCAILDDDSLRCWGNNTYGQMGAGTTTRGHPPTAVDLGVGRTAKAVNPGEWRTCAILDDDSLVCWGFNNKGQLGDGTTTNRHAPTLVNLGAGRSARAIRFGGTTNANAHTCAILDDDSLVCWGSNNTGQLGDGTTTDRHEPTAVDLGASRTAQVLHVGKSHNCAILDDNSLKCWGANGNGQLGDGTTTDRNAPTAVNLGDGRTAQAVQLGKSHTCAILDDNSLKCWGANAKGQLGDGTTTDRHTPTAVDLGDSRTAKAVILGDNRTCAILDDDSLKCWGDNGSGRLGDGTSTDRNEPTAVNLGDDRTAQSVTLGTSHTCAILDDHSLLCWGDSTSGNSPTPGLVDLGDGRTVQAVTLGERNTCAILDDDSLVCWGRNDPYGQLGDGTATDRPAPTLVNLGVGRTAKSVSFGWLHTCAILDDDSLKCWGTNERGEMGVATRHRGDGPGEMGDNLPWVNFD